MNILKKIQGILFTYFLSIAGKARLSLARVALGVFSIVYFGIKLAFGFNVPFIVYISYSILANFILLYTYVLAEDKFERILRKYLNFFYDRFPLFNRLVNLFLEFYLGFFKVPLYGFSFLHIMFMLWLMGAEKFAMSMVCVYGFIGFFSFIFFGFYVQSIEYFAATPEDRWNKKSEIMNELINIEPVLLPIQSYYPLKFHNNEPMQEKMLLFLDNVVEKANNYYNQEYRTMKIFANHSQIRNFIIVNGKFIAIGGAGAGTLGVGGFLLNEEFKRRHNAQQMERDRELQREKLKEKLKWQSQENEKNRQWQSQENDRNRSGGWFGFGKKGGGNGPKSSVFSDFFDWFYELCSSLYLLFAGNSFFISAFINFIVVIIKKIFML